MFKQFYKSIEVVFCNSIVIIILLGLFIYMIRTTIQYEERTKYTILQAQKVIDRHKKATEELTKEKETYTDNISILQKIFKNAEKLFEGIDKKKVFGDEKEGMQIL